MMGYSIGLFGKVDLSFETINLLGQRFVLVCQPVGRVVAFALQNTIILKIVKDRIRIIKQNFHRPGN